MSETVIKPTYRVEVCTEVPGGLHQCQIIPPSYTSKKAAINHANRLWTQGAIPDLVRMRIIGANGAQVGEDLFHS